MHQYQTTIAAAERFFTTVSRFGVGGWVYFASNYAFGTVL